MAGDIAGQFRRDEHGTTAVLFALVCVVILAVAGFALDMQRTVSTEARLQSALDAAALAGARTLEDATASDAEIRAVAEDAFLSNLLTGHKDVTCGSLSIGIERETGKVTVDADCDFQTTFGQIAAVDRIALSERAVARAAITRLDVAFMLDVSGSMGGQKLADLKTAAGDAIDILITEKTGSRVRVALNTYATSVNAGVYAEDVVDIPWWMTPTTCVSERSGIAAWTDDAPGLGKWLGLKATSCPASSIEPLTADVDTLKSAIDAMTAGGRTAGHLGVAWAWYLISPEWSDVWPVASAPHAYGEPNTKKAVILMTDGVFNESYEFSLGTSGQQAEKHCQSMRDKDIIIYAVAFEAPYGGRQVLKKCAGDENRYFEADNGSELQEAYTAIASQLTNLSLTE